MKQLKHVISIKQFLDKELLQKLFERADQFQAMAPAEYPKPLDHMTLASIFFEPSTRTRLSFETAIQNLGGRIISVENAGENSSGKKGETIEDTTRMLNAYAEGIVMRHPEIGAADRASKVSDVPVFNGGDGAGEHPTQALLDTYTIYRHFKFQKDLKVALVGDLLYGRTVHSLVPIFALLGFELFLIAPSSLQMPKEQLSYLDEHKVKYTLLESWDDVLGELDVIYMTRVQKERFKLVEDYQVVKDSFILTMAQVNKMKPSAIIMHPLPRVNEIATEVDADPRAQYFQEAKNGLYLRMALLEYIYSA